MKPVTGSRISGVVLIPEEAGESADFERGCTCCRMRSSRSRPVPRRWCRSPAPCRSEFRRCYRDRRRFHVPPKMKFAGAFADVAKLNLGLLSRDRNRHRARLHIAEALLHPDTRLPRPADSPRCTEGSIVFGSFSVRTSVLLPSSVTSDQVWPPVTAKAAAGLRLAPDLALDEACSCWTGSRWRSYPRSGSPLQSSRRA